MNRIIPLSYDKNYAPKKQGGLLYGFLISAIFCVMQSASAQQINDAGRLSGMLQDDLGNPASYATISLLSAKDTSLISTKPATAQGGYMFADIPGGTYLLKVSAVGFVTSLSGTISVTAGKETVIPLWRLKASANSLATVNVTATKPLVEQKSDRVVVNVDKSVLSAGNSAMDIISRAPGVTVDKDDNISLNGKEGVTVMINDKQTYLTASQLAAMLRATEGTAIKSVELITNPSAKFDAAGSSGIINIKLKKPTEKGTNGSLTVGAGYGKSAKDRTALSLNHQEGKLNIFGDVSRDDNKSITAIDTKRILTDLSGVDTYLHQQTTDRTTEHNNAYRAGVDYGMSSQNNLGLLLSGYSNTVPNPGQIRTDIGNSPDLPESYQNTTYINRQAYHNFTVNVHDKFKIDSAGQELSMDLDRASFRNTTFSNYHTFAFLADGSPDGLPVDLQYQTPSAIKVYSANADYTLPLNKKVRLESGLKFTSVKNDDDAHAQQLNNGIYENDSRLTNHFIYKEQIRAAYVNMSGSYKNTTFSAGMRAEHTGTTSDLITDNESYRRKYLNFFPSILIRRAINDKNDIGFSFSRRIDRPEYDNLNPFLVYSDQYTYSQGNPLLRPQFTNKVELSYVYNEQINVSLGYSRTSDVITHVVETDTKTNVTTQTVLNVQRQNNYTLNIYSPYKITKWWDAYANLNGVYRSIKSDSLLGGTFDKSKFAYTIKSTQNFRIALGYKAELMSTYQSSRIYGIYIIQPHYTTDFGVSHSFDQKRASIKISVSDIFNTGTFRTYTNYQASNVLTFLRPESRIGRVTLNYNFGSARPRGIEHEGGTDEVRGRVKGA